MAYFTKNDDCETVLELEDGRQIDYDSVKDACMPGYSWPSAKSVVHKWDQDRNGRIPSESLVEEARQRLEEANA